jgi:hypothetical protein
MLPDFRFVIASIATAVMVVTLGLGTIAAFRTGAVSGLPPMGKRTDPLFADLGMRRQAPDPASTRGDPGNDGGASNSWTVLTVPESAQAPSGTRPPAAQKDTLVAGAMGSLPESRDARGFIDQRLIVDAPSVMAGDPRSPSASPLGNERHADGTGAGASAVAPRPGGDAAAAANDVPSQRLSLREAADNDQSSELTVASMPARPRKGGADAAAKGARSKSPITSQKTRNLRLVRRYRPMNDSFGPTPGYVPIFGAEQSFGPDRPLTYIPRPLRSYNSVRSIEPGMAPGR